MIAPAHRSGLELCRVGAGVGSVTPAAPPVAARSAERAAELTGCESCHAAEIHSQMALAGEPDCLRDLRD
jgi:hypothetical protein